MTPEALERAAMAAFAMSVRIHGEEPNFGRSTPENPRGFSTERGMWDAIVRVVIAVSQPHGVVERLRARIEYTGPDPVLEEVLEWLAG